MKEFKTTIYSDTIEGKLGLGVDYYKGETGKSGADEVYIGAEPPTDPQVKLWVDTEAQSVGAVDWNDVENKPNFATVAESGSYNDLIDKPVIPEAPDLTPYAKTADLSTVATSGSYNDLTDKPNLFSGNYEDLTNKPTIPEAPDLTNYATKDDLANAKPDLTPYAKTADLSTVATSGSYEDLTNKPTIPEPYTLPTASTTTLGGVKVDGSTITIADGVISSAGGGGTDLSNTLLINSSKSNDIDNTPKIADTLILGSDNRIGYRNQKTIKDTILLGNQHWVMHNTYATLIMGTQNFVQGNNNDCSIIVGQGNIVNTTQNLQYSIIVGQSNHIEQGSWPYDVWNVYGFGNNLELYRQNFVIGSYNIADSDSNYKLIIGNGTSDARTNSLTVDLTGNLAIAGTMSSAGADYAEFFEWKDGNPEVEDRVGYIVSLDGDKIILANEGDYILGVVSGTATVLGDNPEWNWAKRWITDDFGRIQYEDKVIHHEAEERNGETIPAWDETIKAPITNPDYNPDQKYIKRADRPEWSAVGMMGKLYVRDDGTCQVNGFAKPINGVATASTSGTMRVIERVSDNVIRVVIK